ncbi:hypothetical protein NCS57_00505500 [Fusarium keratoplasticum]|uniref:Uncharacterized protein n=1 Tax=Fusarium keratoplasticum TaxID=1328300 RepID=A0ACC0R738_9HYPO|nr:hypothetical protein NCS57_00505500 [Fusarium keratoplasticum]KAI8676023.1 hypothetical protein NCS57_00505500 [Fusarium keratoplasticum]
MSLNDQDQANPSQAQIDGPPYLVTTAATVGGRPTPSVDDPICGVFIAFFLASAVFNMTIYIRNRRRGHKFLFSAVLFGFSIARIVACSLRIVVGSKPHQVNTVIASQVFNSAGVVMIFVINLFFAQRILRAYHPRLGWGKPATLVARFLLFSLIATLIMTIIAVVYSFYTFDVGVRKTIRHIQLFSATYIAVMAFLPLPITVVSALLSSPEKVEPFGRGRMETKVYLLTATSMLLAFGAGFRAGTSYVIRPITDPAWFHHKACFYIVNFAIEIIVVYSYALSRFDRRFFIPNGSSGPGDYSRIEEVPIPLGDQSADFSLGSQDGLSIRDVQLQKVRNVGA